MHSVADDVIPFAHAVILMEKFVKKNGKDNIEFL